MSQRTEIIRVLMNAQQSNVQGLTQREIASSIYADDSHYVAIYTALQRLVNEGIISRNGSPSRYALARQEAVTISPRDERISRNQAEFSFEEAERYNKKWIINNLIYNATKDTLYPLVPGIDFYVFYQPFNHTPVKLPENKMAVYSFHTTDECLKVGQVSVNSSDRYQRQHYKVYRDRANSSTLAKSVLEDENNADLNLTDETIGEWMKTNCERYDVIINVPMENGIPDKRKEKIVLNMVEGLLQMYFNPKYEG